MIQGGGILQQHYMGDTSAKLEQIGQLVEWGEYFPINRPRQFGKTIFFAQSAQIPVYRAELNE